MQVCIWGVVCKKHSGSVSEILGENLECIHEMSGKCSKNMWEVPKIFASFQEVSRMFPGSFWEVSGESLVHKCTEEYGRHINLDQCATSALSAKI